MSRLCVRLATIQKIQLPRATYLSPRISILAFLFELFNESTSDPDIPEELLMADEGVQDGAVRQT